MIVRLARRLGFQQSVPVSVVDDWLLPRTDGVVALAPRAGVATCVVDAVGRLQPAAGSYTLDWTLAAGARWVSAIESARVRQRLVAPAVLETVVETPAGTVVHRVAAAVVDGEPVALVEIENEGGVAVAVGLVVRPLVHGGRGHLRSVHVGPTGFDLGEQGSVRFERAGATAVADGEDLLTALPDPDAGAAQLETSSRSGGAQAAAVFALPHTSTMQAVVELAGRVRPDAAVPAIADVQRGWRRHLEAGASIDLGETDVSERIQVASRVLLSSWPTRSATLACITALAELGFADDAPRLFGELDRLDDDPELLVALARWFQLGDHLDALDTLDAAIGPIARAAHAVGAVRRLRGPAWMPAAFDALASGLDDIDQPDVAARIRSLQLDPEPTTVARPNDDCLSGSSALIELSSPTVASRWALAARSAVLADAGSSADLLPELPEHWRGRSIDVFRAPIGSGVISFGVRWHGPRPALLWQVEADGPLTVTAASIDPGFSTTDVSGEALLDDPGWARP